MDKLVRDMTVTELEDMIRRIVKEQMPIVLTPTMSSYNPFKDIKVIPPDFGDSPYC